MKTARGKYLWLFLALLLPALTAGVFFGADRLLDELIRPRLAALAANRLSAEVAIGRLAWHDGALLIDDLTIDRPHRYRLAVPRIRLALSAAGLLRRQISALEITSPDLLLQPAPAEEEGGLPSRLPISFQQISLHDGRIVFQLPESSYGASRIHFEASGGDPYDFSLTALLGTADAAPVQLAGRAEWREGLAVVLETFQLDNGELLAGPLDFTVPADAGPAGGGRLHLARLDRASLQRLMAGLGRQADFPEGWDFVLQGLDLQFSLAEGRLSLGVQVAAAGISRGELNMPLAALNLVFSASGGEWRGTAEGRLAENNPFQLSFTSQGGRGESRLQATLAEPGRFKTLVLGGEAPPLRGGLHLDASVSGFPEEPAWQVEIKGIPVKTAQQDYRLDLTPLQLSGRIERAGGEWSGRGDLRLADRDLAVIEGDRDQLTATLRPVSWKQLRSLFGTGLRDLLQEGEGLRGDLRLGQSSTGSWSGSSRLAARRVRQAENVLTEPTVDLAFTELKDGSWSGSLSMKGKTLTGGRLNLEGLAASGKWRFAGDRLAFTRADAAARVDSAEQLSARLSLTGSGFWQPDRWHVELAKLDLEDVELFSSDGLAGLAGGLLRAKGSLDGARGKPLRLALDADLGAAEGLWGAYYADLSDLPGKVAVRLRLEPAIRRLQLDRLRLTLAEIGSLQAAGTLIPEGLDLTGELELPNLAGAPADLLRRTLGESHTLLGEARLAGALRTAVAIARQGDGWRLRGEILPADLAFQVPGAGISLAGASGRLPFELTFGELAPGGQSEERTGSLRFDALQLGPVSLAGEAIPVVATADRLAFAAPLVLQLAGGRMTVDRLELGRNRQGLRFDGLFTVAGIELEALSRQLELPPMKGRIDADLGHIRYADGVLRSEGEAQIDVFGGSIGIRNIRLDVTSLAYLQIFADLEFTAIDLYQLTQTLSFGVMNGIIDGHVRELRLFGATPAGFRARIESREEGTRNISVKALNNLTILSQGGLSAALSRGVYRFIDFYRYRKIGIVCELEKDVFHLRGTARPDSDHYLVFGGYLPPKIDIIAPPAAISFSEMLKRLQRIERAERGG